MNGFSTEEETPGSHNQICCLLDEGERCSQPAGNASYNKRIQKTVAQKKLKLSIDPNVSFYLYTNIFKFVKMFMSNSEYDGYQ